MAPFELIFKKHLKNDFKTQRFHLPNFVVIYKTPIKLNVRDVGYRLVYQVIDHRLVIVVVAIGRRDHEEAYLAAAKRIS